MSLPRYASYKDSGVEWLGDVPAHWETKRLKYLGQPIIGLTYDPSEVVDADHGTLVLRSSNVQNGGITLDDNVYVSARIPDELRTKPGDILICSRNGSRALIGKNAVIDCASSDVTFGAFMTIFRSDLNRYLRWVFNSALFDYQAGTFLTTTVNQLTTGNLRGFEVPLPPERERDEIASFLESQTIQFDGLLEEQRRLIGLLKEKRQAVISHAVTKGLNPDAPMKSSGVDWLGYVPSHWQVLRLGSLYSEVNEPGEEDLPVLSVSIHSGVSDKELDDDELDRKVTRSEDRTKYKKVSPNDLTYNMMRAWQGGFGSVTVLGMVSPAYIVARPKAPISSRFVEYLLRTPCAVEEMRRHSQGVTDFRLRLYWEEFKNIKVAIPPIAEQEAMLNYIIRFIGETDELMNENARAIDLLQERRSALISAAVTGKIDVRQALAECIA